MTILAPIKTALAKTLNKLAGQPNSLDVDFERNVKLPEDLYAHPEAQTEWWYYTGHCETEKGRRFGFELVFFKRQTDLDTFGILPVRLIGNPMYAAHFATSNLETREFRYTQKRSFRYPFDPSASASVDGYDLRIDDWQIEGDEKEHRLHVPVSRDVCFHATLRPTKPVASNGHGFPDHNAKRVKSKHFSLTQMDVSGQIGPQTGREKFSGKAWMDREFGTWFQRNWDWFSIQLNDGTELMIYRFRDEGDMTSDASHGTFVDPDGQCKWLSANDLQILPTRFWTSARSGITYPVEWVIRVQSLAFEIEVKPHIDDQEIDARASTMVIYWEGACEVKGTRDSRDIAGNAYAELVGYDKQVQYPGLFKFINEYLFR